MKLFLCVDDEGGMTFMGRRVSRDRVVYADMVDMAGEGLAVFPYSLPLFSAIGYAPRVLASSENITADDCIFIEDRSPKDYLHGVDTLVIYRWNRLYPSDKKLDLVPSDFGFSLIESRDMVGNSHEKITKEIYKR